jgi:cytochrome c oxidase subunit II
LAPVLASRRRRLLVLVLVAGLAALLLVPAGALAGAVTPESGGSPNANEIDSLYKILLYVALFVFVTVEGALLYSLLRFRKRRRGMVPAQIRGNTNLEISWTVAAALVLAVLTGVTFAKLPSIKDPAPSGPDAVAAANGTLLAAVDQPPPPGKALNIDVNGQQYIWRFTYPNGAYSYTTMVVPVDTTVILRIRSQDVAHSWWIPKLGPKFDAIPGYTNKNWFKIPRPGVFRGQCAELCGRNHANMVASVRAIPADEYQAWVTRQKQLIQQANQLAVQQRKSESPIPG